MKIVFWAPVHGQACTTSNILISTLLSGLEHRKKCLLTQTHFNFNNLEAPLIGSNSKNEASLNFFRDVGIDALARNFKASKLNNEVIENCCISLANTNVSLLPGTSKTNRESFEFEMEAILLNLIRNIEENYEIVFVDTSSGDNSLSFKLIEDADLTVVNLSQNICIVDNFFENYRNKINGKVFYLFGSYDCNSKYNINNIRRKYSNEISMRNSGVIPYNTEYLDAQCDCKVVDWIKNNIKFRKEKNKYFMLKSRKAVEKMMKYAGVTTYTEERM